MLRRMGGNRRHVGTPPRVKGERTNGTPVSPLRVLRVRRPAGRCRWPGPSRGADEAGDRGRNRLEEGAMPLSPQEDTAADRIRRAVERGESNLDLGDLGLAELPAELGGLSHLRRLDLSK